MLGDAICAEAFVFVSRGLEEHLVVGMSIDGDDAFEVADEGVEVRS